MIPYEELVAALNHWRAEQGLPTGDTDFLGAPPPPPTNLVEIPGADPNAISADHLATGDSTDTVDVSDIEVLSEETAYEYDNYDNYDDQAAAGQPQADDDGMPDLDYEEQPFVEEPVAYDDQQLVAEEPAYGEQAAESYEAQPLDQAPAPDFGEGEATSYDAPAEDVPLYAEADELQPPPVVDVDQPVEDRAGTEEEATIVAGAHGELPGDDDATRVAADEGQPRPNLDTDLSPVVSEDELPPVPPVAGETGQQASGEGTRNDATIDVDLGADVIEEAPVSGEIGGNDPKPE